MHFNPKCSKIKTLDKKCEVLNMGMAERIKERRIAMGYTQEELATKLGLQKSAIAKYENGRVENIKRSVISNMAKILECSPSYLMDWEESLPNYDIFDELLADTEWSYESFSHCDENPNCPLTDNEKISMWVDGTTFSACENCSCNSGYYYLTNGEKYYKFEEREFNALSACLKPYLLFRINEAISRKAALSKQEFEYTEGLIYYDESPYDSETLNAAHSRTDIDTPEDVDTSDDDIMDDENF